MRKTIALLSPVLIILFLGCEKSGDTMSSETGTGGSLARFTIASDHLYLADRAWITPIDISNPAAPVEKPRIHLEFEVETIFPYEDKLFIGSTTGMFIYSISDPSTPKLLGKALHLRSCDPVVANDTASYVTLRGDSRCGPAQDGLYIYNIKDLSKPVQTSLLPLGRPGGLGLKDSVVFVCRNEQGLTAVNVSDMANPTVMYTLKDAVYKDVIPYGDLLICYISTGILLYDMSDLRELKLLGTLNN